MCAYALRAAGYRVGLYTSPHLHDVRERFRVLTPADPDGHVDEATFAALVDALRPAASTEPDVTWFELFTALALLHFAHAAVDAAVIEVGLGGRLDATNVITPLVSVITRISLDHTTLLGNTLAAIAGEKGGIIKPGVPVISAPQEPEAAAVLRALAAARGAPLSVAGVEWQATGRFSPAPAPHETITIDRAPSEQALIAPPQSFDLSLLGAHQRENGVVAVAALAAVQSQLPRLTVDAVRRGLAETRWPGRLQVIDPGPPPIVVDAAHNAESAQRLLASLRTIFDFDQLWLVFGAGVDKDIAGMLDVLLPDATALLVVQADHPRAATTGRLQEMARARGRDARPFPDTAAALTHAPSAAGSRDLICVTGSLFVVAEVLRGWGD